MTKKWIDVLDKVVHGMNHARSRVLGGLRPVDVFFHNAREVRRKLYGPPGKFYIKSEEKVKKPKFKIGDFVRMAKGRHVFRKGYLPTFEDEILEVIAVKPGGPQSLYGVTRYKVKDWRGEEFTGYFYDEDLQKVHKDENTAYRIEKVIRRKIDKDGRKKSLVKYFGDPTPIWIDDSDFVTP